MGIKGYLRACVVCGRNYGRINLFCRTCQGIARRMDPGFHVLSGGITVRYLFPWTRETGAFLSALTVALKGDSRKESLSQLAREFVWGHGLQSSQIPENTKIIPCPARSAERTHALTLAIEFCQLLNLELNCPLVHSGTSRPQKLLSRKKRSTMRFKSKTRLANPGPVVFVDDVVTTGSTARAAAKALKSSKNFQVWALSCRIH